MDDLVDFAELPDDFEACLGRLSAHKVRKALQRRVTATAAAQAPARAQAVAGGAAAPLEAVFGRAAVRLQAAARGLLARGF